MTSSITAAPSVEFDPPIVSPVQQGLFAVIDAANAWENVGTGANRFSINGINVRNWNYGSESSTGIWGAGWCGRPDDETGYKGYNAERPDFPDPFDPITVWAWDACDFTAKSREEVERNAEHWLKIRGSQDVARAFADRMLTDATPVASTSFLDAVGKLEAEIAKTGLPGFIHASPYYAGFAADVQAARGENLPKTILDTTWVFDGGYVDGLEDVLVATSQPYGWKDAPAITTGAVEPSGGVTYANLFVAVAEQTFAVGYEKLISAVTVTL